MVVVPDLVDDDDAPRVVVVPDRVAELVPDLPVTVRVVFDADVAASVPRVLVSVDERPFEELVDPLLTTVRPSPMTPPLPDSLDTSWVGFVFSVV